MKNYLTILAFVIVTFCLVCGGCQPESAVKDEVSASQPAVAAAVAVKPEVEAAAVVEAAPVKPVVEPAVRSRSARSRRWGVYGDWDVKVDYNGREMESILSFSRAEDKLVGYWISFWGMNELADITFEDGALSFTQTYPGRDGQTRTSKFAGTIEDGKVSGTVSSDRGESQLEGARSKRIPRAVGSWAMKLKMGEREFTSTLVVTAGAEGELGAEWQSEWGEHEITDVEYERGKLTFKRKSKMRDREWESTFEGNIRRNTLSGAIKSERGELTAEGNRIGGSLIGNWNLEIESERGARKQRLKVNPDMSGMYGPIAIEKVNLEGDKVSFETVLEFGERKFEMSFAGQLEESNLTGELTTSRGSQKVTGVKVVRRSRRGRAR